MFLPGVLALSSCISNWLEFISLCHLSNFTLWFSFIWSSSCHEEVTLLWAVFIFSCWEQSFLHLEDWSPVNLKMIFSQQIYRKHCKVNSHHLLCFCSFHLELIAENILPESLKEIISLSKELQMQGEVNWILADTSKRYFDFNLSLQRIWKEGSECQFLFVRDWCLG